MQNIYMHREQGGLDSRRCPVSNNIRKNVKGVRQTLKARKINSLQCFPASENHVGVGHLATFLVPFFDPVC